MFCRNRTLLSLFSVIAFASPVAAHYHILLPDKPAANRDEAITFTYRFGHPFEHQLFATQKPASFMLLMPEGHAVEHLSKLERVEEPGAGGNPITSFRCKFTATQRGDHVLMVRSNPVWMPDEKLFFQDTVKVILHVQTQNGWDSVLGSGMEWVPLTRPYGMRAGTIFQAQLTGAPEADRENPVQARRTPGRALPWTLVEVERYNATPPKELPPEEHITRTLKTDPNGIATVTLPEPGWWALTAVREVGTMERAGRNYPLRLRSTLWVYVDGQIPLSPVK
jgi:cobalt/nickel transport protein